MEIDAPATFCGYQEGLRGEPPYALWTLTEDIPGHPRWSTVATDTLRACGYVVQEPPEEECICPMP